MKPKIIVVCGPTATGKSDYAVKLAKKINGEIISADSRQVYKGLDIGSGKITKKEMAGIPHHLLDVASPRKIFSVSQYKKLASKKIKEIIKKRKSPIICGGTGFYIYSLIYDLNLPEVKPNKELRERLESYTTEELAKFLKNLDKKRFNSIDSKNRVRLIRALEIVATLGKVPKIKRNSPFEVEWHYLDFEDEVLKERIHKRLIKRIKQGMKNEVKNLHEKEKISWKRLESLGLEYRYISLYLQNKINKEEMLKKLELEIWHYAKRQRTWFKKYAS